MTQAKPRFNTLEEYLNYEDDREGRFELVNGEIVELPAESDLNVLIATFLTSIFLQFLPYYQIRRGTEIFVSSRSVTSRYPDFIVISEMGHAMLKGAKRSVITPDMPTPLLVVEVVSPGRENNRRDYTDKRKEYAERRIPEYWLIDPSNSVLTVLCLDGQQYVEVGQFRNQDSVISPSFPELQLTAEQVLNVG